MDCDRHSYFRIMVPPPLQGLLCIEVAGVLAGPAVGMFMAECGARVVKVENKRSGGDVTRRWKLPEESPSAPLSAYFCSVNHGKEHMFLDLTDVSDRRLFDGLVRDADVLLTNHLEEDAVKLGLERKRLSALNPRLIHGHIKGFMAQPERPAFDVVLQAETGYISMTGSDAEKPAKLPVAMIDVLTAHQLKEAILLALLERGRSGAGAYVEVSLEEAALTGLVNQASNQLMTGHVARPLGTLHPNIAPYGELFDCADGGRIVLAVGSDDQFRRLCTVLGDQTMALHEGYLDNLSRVRNRKSLAERLEPLMASWQRDTLLRELMKAGVPCGAVRDIAEVMESQAARSMIAEEEMEGMLTRRIRGNAFTISPLVPS